MHGEPTLSAPSWESYIHAVAAREARIALAKQELARRSLLDFTIYFHPNYKVGWFNKELCELLDAFIEAVERQLSPCLLISAPPRHGKSELVSVKLPAYALGKHPDWEIVCATYGQDLATDFGAKVRQHITDPRFASLFPELSLDDSSRAKDNFLTTVLGGYKAVGIGGALTGRGAHIADVDDPVKDKEEADSETMRERAWNWYNTVLATRLHPGGGKIITQCMTGDTRVRMADGTETPLRDIRPGAIVATFENGNLATARIRNWINHGSDSVFAIRMTSGTVVKANARHPFLVTRPEGLEWVRLKHLRAGDRILRAIGGSGATASAAPKGATHQPSAKAGACPTTTPGAGGLDIGHRAAAPSLAEAPTSSIAMASPWPSSTRGSPSKAASARYASSHQGRISAHTGKGCASTTAMSPDAFADYSAMTAISPSDTPKPLPCSVPLRATFDADEIAEIVEAGQEDVFDIEVERTENFIANGLVSHNTRWHEDDLTGRVEEQAALEPEGEQWTKFTYTAIAEEDEYQRDPATGKPISPPALLRKKGEALHPERYSSVWLERRKKSMPVRDWSALYQQNPVPATGIVFDVSWFKFYPDAEAPTNLRKYLTTDLAISEKTTADFTVCWPFGIDPHKHLWFLPDMVRERGLKQHDLARLFVQKVKLHSCNYVVVEGEKLWLTFKDILDMEMAKESTYFGIQSPPPRNDPVQRAGPLVGMMQAGMVHFPESLKELVLREFLAFPAGKKDDTVSAASWGAWLLGKLPSAAPQVEPVVPDAPPAWSYDWKKARGTKTTDDFAARHKPRKLNGKAR